MSVHVNGVTKLTYREYRHFPNDGRRHEIIDGEHYVSPSPTNPHQAISRHIQFALYRQIEETGRGFVINAPMDVELGETDIVQPDIIVVLAENRSIMIPSRIRGVPDLVVEILSPSTVKHDQELKLALYESHSVPEYWVVDGEDRRVDRYVLGDARYRPAEAHHDEIRYADAVVDLAAVWARL
jgi:Uma2 family endonuclease